MDFFYEMKKGRIETREKKNKNKNLKRRRRIKRRKNTAKS